MDLDLLAAVNNTVAGRYGSTRRETLKFPDRALDGIESRKVLDWLTAGGG